MASWLLALRSDTLRSFTPRLAKDPNALDARLGIPVGRVVVVGREGTGEGTEASLAARE